MISPLSEGEDVNIGYVYKYLDICICLLMAALCCRVKNRIEMLYQWSIR